MAAKKPKSWVLTRAIDAVIARDDTTTATFHDADVDSTYDDSDPAVARAVVLYPDCFKPA